MNTDNDNEHGTCGWFFPSTSKIREKVCIGLMADLVDAAPQSRARRGERQRGLFDTAEAG
jgi:hypothetical protein